MDYNRGNIHEFQLNNGEALITAMQGWFAEKVPQIIATHLQTSNLTLTPKVAGDAVEVRNENMLQPEYFDMLRSHGVAHVFNSWTHMPEVSEQIELIGTFTTDFTVARFLLKPGRTYEQAVKAFEPYESTKEVNQVARDAAAALILSARESGRRPSYIYVNNRLEGNAPSTIAAVLEKVQHSPTA